jgi:predicted esterase
MTFRAATAAAPPVDGVIAVCGDVPPELDPVALARVPAALIAHGARDEWYTAQKFDADVRRLGDAGVRVRPVPFEGAHEWSDDVTRSVSVFLNELQR